MRVLNVFFIFMISTQMSLGTEAVIQSYNQALGKWGEKLKAELDQSVTTRMNKLLSNPRELKKQAYQALKSGQQLFDKDFAQVDQNLLRQVKAKLKNGQHTVSLPQGKNIRFRLDPLPRGYITINGEKFLTKNFNDYQKIQAFVRKHYSSQKTSFLNLIGSVAYAQIEIVFILAGLAVLGLISSVVEWSKDRVKKDIFLSNYKKHLINAKQKCQDDKQAIVRNSLKSRPFSNDTLVFMQRLEEISKKTSSHTAGLISCDLLLENPTVILYSLKDFKEVCRKVRELQNCLEETKSLMKERGLTVDNSGRTGPHDKSSYDVLADSFSKAVLE